MGIEIRLKTTLILVAAICPFFLSAQPHGTVRGVVTDGGSGQRLPYVTVAVLNSQPVIGTVTDQTGAFTLGNLPVGRYDIQASFLGYQSAEFREVMVSSGKEVVLQIAMRENAMQVDGIVVRPQVNKEVPLNTMALAGGRMLSVDEASRYAGGFDDPARLVTAFAGVAGSMNSNGIAIRGNSPQFLQWRLEGIEAVNPTHFSDITGVGGGILTAFSSHTLGNSDFFTGAFPAEYGNALSGVFDMQLRNGNNENWEHALQVGTLGLEASSEGPMGNNTQASYLINYRYSTMALAGDLFPDMLQQAAGMRYQDMSFKFNFPTRKAGTFTLWGIWLKDHYIENSPEDISEWDDDWGYDADFKQTKAVGGAGHKILLGNNSYLKSSLAANYTDNDINSWERYIDGTREQHNANMTNTNWNLTFDTYLNTKFSASHTNRTGVNVTGLFYDLDYWMPEDVYDHGTVDTPVELSNFANSDGNTAVVSAFSESQFRIGSRLTANVGLRGSYFRLNGETIIEPRASVRWLLAPKHAISLAYGLHSRRENTDYYFVQDPETKKFLNKDLRLGKAHHVVLSYDWSISEYLRLKVEPYYQFLYDIPVADASVEGGTMSIINYRNFWMMDALTNKGEGHNYGVDVTLERYLHRGWYYLFTASLFESRYKDANGDWRNTRLNRNYMINALGGKEWAIRKRNILNVSLRFAYMGGERYIPFDEDASIEAKKPEFDYARAFEPRLPAQFIGHFNIGYKMNREKVAHTIALQMINMTGSEEFAGYSFNARKNIPERFMSAISIPNISYKLEF